VSDFVISEGLITSFLMFLRRPQTHASICTQFTVLIQIILVIGLEFIFYVFPVKDVI